MEALDTAVAPEVVPAPPTAVASSLAMITAELDSTLTRIGTDAAAGLSATADLILDARRVFVLGAGRSGLALRMTAMRLMHLGLEVHVVGEVTAPAIGAGDLLLTASGSGTTGGIVRAAETAIATGARIAAITTAPASPLAAMASAVVVVPAAGKLDRSESASAQYAGSLFEQTVVLVGDALFDALWRRSGQSADDLWPRHSNLE
ncbi:3-hexulose-6-phosphate isomerase [Agromyces aureus]|uniref:3-hexulose-6-phosphate isomerase n=2 Tax=Agromyces aureus TaxID=453304 RepID=A0A191WKV1_9MICO|nr:6-phospho-3-hexuloisomerase [Agromyces aureus]ANJ28857.1 3-hexulose-6-phosphate isomerase [Agromyces aureus]